MVPASNLDLSSAQSPLQFPSDRVFPSNIISHIYCTIPLSVPTQQKKASRNLICFASSWILKSQEECLALGWPSMKEKAREGDRDRDKPTNKILKNHHIKGIVFFLIATHLLHFIIQKKGVGSVNV